MFLLIWHYFLETARTKYLTFTFFVGFTRAVLHERLAQGLSKLVGTARFRKGFGVTHFSSIKKYFTKNKLLEKFDLFLAVVII